MKKNDMILVVGVLILAAAAFLWTGFLKSEDGAKAVVYINGEVSASYELIQDGEYKIETEEGSNSFLIKDGKADMIEADCPDGLCVKQKSVSKNGETIVCLPHKVVIEIEGGSSGGMDAITR